MKRIILALGLVTLAILANGPLHAYEALQGPTELLYWDKTNAYPGYTWFGVRGTTYLVDMEGRVAHTWPIGTNPHHWQTTALRYVTFGVFFPKEARCESELSLRDFELCACLCETAVPQRHPNPAR